MTTNYAELVQFVQDINPLIIIATETHITPDIEEDEINIRGYCSVVSYSNSRHTGGVIIYVKNFLKCCEVGKFDLANEYWCAVIKVTLDRTQYIVGGVYRSPNGSGNDFLNFFEDLLDTDNIVNNDVVLMGDFNFDLLKNTSQSKRLIRIIQSAGFFQLREKPTRYLTESQSLLDLIISNKRIEEANCSFPKITDHDIIGVELCSVFNSYRNNGNRSYFSRNLCKENFGKIELDLVAKNWNYDSIDVNVLWKNIEKNIRSSLDNIAPIVEKKIRQSKSWIDHELRTLQTERDRLYKRFQFTLRSEDYDNFKFKRNQVVSLLRRKEISYYEDNIDKCRSNSGKMWRFLKSVLSPSGSEARDFSCIEAGDRSVRDTFNEFYVRSIDEVINSID